MIEVGCVLIGFCACVLLFTNAGLAPLTEAMTDE